ncbi:tripartite tricarboxylate transporter permease [Corticibacterium sp. UT-5YL-CI-8]|nr:tripartite tricarboxylate transporter permease [Tianweitania sp. UT-5YL-CI-8]
MELFSHLALGFSVVLTAQNLFFCFLGCFIGTAIGVLPGVGPLATIAMLLPLTYTMGPETALIMLAGIYYGALYGGSTTAILINLPGESASAVTTLDGYQMARQGRAGPALAVAALGSFFAGTVVTVLIAIVAGPMTKIALSFGSHEYFALMVLGLISSVALASGSLLKALGMIILGLLFGMTGTDIYTGQARFTWGMIELSDGLDLVAISVGLFGIAEILRNMQHQGDNTRTGIQKVGSLMPSREDFRRSVGPVLRGTALGSVLGVLPGGGALLSSFASYTMEKKLSKHPEQFGHGAIEGVAGPESANNAGAQSAFIPMLSLGIPGNAVTALMLGAMILQGIAPGPNVLNQQPELFWGLIVSMWIGNLMLVVLNLPLIGIWVSMLKVPYTSLFPAIVIFCCIGVFSVHNSSFAVYQITIFGALGYMLYRLEAEPAPFILGFILGPLLEEHLRRAMIISRGDALSFLERPISATLLVCAALALAAVSLPYFSKKREQIFVEED